MSSIQNKVVFVLTWYQVDIQDQYGDMSRQTKVFAKLHEATKQRNEFLDAYPFYQNVHLEVCKVY